MKLAQFSKTVFVLLFLAFCSHGLWPQQSSVSSATETTPNYEPQSTLPVPESYSNNSEALPQNLTELPPLLLNPNNPWIDLRKWIDEGMKGLDESTKSLSMLEGQLAMLQAETREQELLLKQSQEWLTNLKNSLAEAQNNVDIAVDRMRDAESYALWIDAQNIQLKQETERLKKSAPIAFAFGGLGFGVGVPLFIEGVRSDNQTIMWSGAGVALSSGLVWAAGHYLFKWW